MITVSGVVFRKGSHVPRAITLKSSIKKLDIASLRWNIEVVNAPPNFDPPVCSIPTFDSEDVVKDDAVSPLDGDLVHSMVSTA